MQNEHRASFAVPASTSVLINLLIVLCMVVALVPTTLAYLDITLRLSTDLSEGSMIRQLQLSSIFLIAAFIAYRHLPVALPVLKALNPFLLLVVIYCAASIVWSPYPVVTLKRVITLGGLVLAGLCVAPPIGGTGQLLRTLRITLTTICVLSFLTAITLPHIGVDDALGGAWRGITWQKNLLGSVSGYATLLWLYEWTTRTENRRISAAGIAFSLFMLLMTKSSTATILTVLACGVYLYTYRTWLQGHYLNTILIISAFCGVVLFVHFYYVVNAQLPTWGTIVGPIAAIFDKGTDLTGRTEIWQILLLSINQHPVTGIGYGAFWLGAGSPAQFIADEFGWMPAHGHNGYLDLLNELGVIGLGLFMGLLVWHIVSILKLMKYDRPQGGLFLAILMMIVISNVTETDFLSSAQFQNIILLFSSVTVSARLYWLETGGTKMPSTHSAWRPASQNRSDQEAEAL